MNDVITSDAKNVIASIDKIDELKEKTFFITGANGLIGSLLIDVLMFLNNAHNYEITIVANARNKRKLTKRFPGYTNDKHFKTYINDINSPITYDGEVDYVINCASNTHPLQYATDPINTILTNIKGTANVLDFASKNHDAKTIFLSSVEIYGENINNVERFKENEMGYIDCNSLRAGYNESKRCGEALCQAYIEERDMDISILRLPRIYGPTVKPDDTKAMSQFINQAVAGKDIILKSKGEQYFSYLYVADAVQGILRCVLFGKCGEVYNLGNEQSDVKLKDLAKMIADVAKVKVIFELPDSSEAKGFSKATVARLDYTKAAEELNFQPTYSIEDGIKRTISALSL